MCITVHSAFLLYSTDKVYEKLKNILRNTCGCAKINLVFLYDLKGKIMFFDLQRASMLKRISALLLDIIVVSILATGFGFVVSAVIGYDKMFERLEASYTAYETKYNVRLDMTNEDFLEMDEAEQARYQEAYDIMAEDPEVSYTYRMVMNMTLIILSLGILLAYIVNDFVIPLILKNGQTIGKKVFDLAVMQTDHTKLRTTSLAIRTVLGRFAIETMVPVLICIMIYFGFIGIFGTVGLGLLLLLQIGVLVATPTNAAIHDLLAQTVVVDMKSQMIFDDLEAKKKYENKYFQNMEEKRGL